jgi:hypothetical protein
MSFCSPDPTNDIANDILWGAEEIAEAIGRKPGPVYHMLELGHLPARKVGRLWTASRRKLLAHLAGE